MTYRHSFVLGLIVTTSLICTSQTVWGASEVSTYSKTDFAMDTVVSETLYTTGQDITTDRRIKGRGTELDFLDTRKFSDISDQSECRQYCDSI